MKRILTTTATALLIGAFLAGCIYKGAKVVEGTDLAVGFTVPGTEIGSKNFTRRRTGADVA